MNFIGNSYNKVMVIENYKVYKYADMYNIFYNGYLKNIYGLDIHEFMISFLKNGSLEKNT